MLVMLMMQATAIDAAAFDRDAWGRFSRAPALLHASEEVTVARDGREGAVSHFRLRLVVRRPGQPDAVRWTDTRTCPAARAAVAAFASVPMPRPDPPAMTPADIVVTADGVGYAVTLPVGYGGGSIPVAATFRSNVGTPLSRWVDGRFAGLRACWPEAPNVMAPPPQRR